MVRLHEFVSHSSAAGPHGAAARARRADDATAFRNVLHAGAPATAGGVQTAAPAARPAAAAPAARPTAAAPAAQAAATAPRAPLDPASAPAVPTAESVFGQNPWEANPTGTGPFGVFGYNPLYFATAATAQKVAAMLGGQVVTSSQLAGAAGVFGQQQPNLMVQLPNGHAVNAGMIASLFTHGYPQSYIDHLIAAEIAAV